MQVNGKNIDKISKGQNVAIHVEEKVNPTMQYIKELKRKNY